MDATPIRHVFDFNRALADGPYAWPGGYPLYFVCADGAALSFEAAKQEAAFIRDAIIGKADPQWQVTHLAINWEDVDLWCAHLGKRIESAYFNDPETA